MSQRLTREHKNTPPSLNPPIPLTLLRTGKGGEDFFSPLWESVCVRGIFALILMESKEELTRYEER